MIEYYHIFPGLSFNWFKRRARSLLKSVKAGDAEALNGYITEAAVKLLQFGFEKLKLRRIWATADVDNDASIGVLERIGMSREGLMRDHKFIRGVWRNSYLYAITAPELDMRKQSRSKADVSG